MFKEKNCFLKKIWNPINNFNIFKQFLSIIVVILGEWLLIELRHPGWNGTLESEWQEFDMKLQVICSFPSFYKNDEPVYYIYYNFVYKISSSIYVSFNLIKPSIYIDYWIYWIMEIRGYFRKIIWAAVVAQIVLSYKTGSLGARAVSKFSSLRLPKNRLTLTQS